jgi:hypothetical protein
VPGNAIHYFCVITRVAGAEVGEEEADVADGRGSQSQGQLIHDIKEQWVHEKNQQEEMRRVLADGALKHETTNWLKRAGWTFTSRRRI